MFGILGKIGSVGIITLGRVIGSHLLHNHLAGLGIGTFQTLIEGLGWRGIVGAGISLYFSTPKFRAGIDSAISSIF